MPTVTPEIVAKLFQQILLGRSVKAEKAPPLRPSPSDLSATAIYKTNDGVLAGACVADIELVHRAGAALCLIPADARLSAARLDPALAENFQEVLNICAQLFAGPDNRRVTLSSVALKPAARPPEAGTLLATPVWRLDLKLTIDGYGSGRLALLSDSSL